MNDAAEMSVVLVTDNYRTIRRVVSRLREQTVQDKLELVIVIPSDQRDASEESKLTGFASVRFAELPSIHPVPSARAAGIRAATAPIVFLGETHSFPHPEFAQALLEAHENDWDAVVPGIANANPESALSWASFLMDYGMWHDTLAAGQIPGAPTWNVAYRKALLMEIDDQLDTAMEHGDAFAVWFHGRGGRAYFEPRARLDHANVSKFRRWAEQRYLCGTLVASSRRSRWGLGKRLFYVAASPLVPWVILFRLRKTLGNLIASGDLPRGAISALVLGTVLRTAGEAVGYLRGASPDMQPRMDDYEIYKLNFTSMTL